MHAMESTTNIPSSVHRPHVRRGDWIRIGDTDCVISVARAAGHRLGDCEVVCHKDDPASSNVRWNGERWEFIGRGPYGGIVNKYLRFRAVVEKLQRGKGLDD